MNKTIEEHHKTLEATKELSHKQGFITIFLIFGIFILWSIFAQIETTITASGQVISQTHTKSIQHRNGGVVKDIFIKDGDEVKKGQKLIILESINEQTQLNSNIKKFDANLISICILEAQATLSKDLNCSKTEKRFLRKEEFKPLMERANILFQSTMRRFNMSIDLLTTEMNMVNSKAQELLYKKRINLKREEFINNSLINLDKMLLNNRIIYDNVISLNNRVSNLVIKAPSSGIITDMKIKGTGEIISPFREIASIVPNSKKFLIEAFVSPTDIEKIYKGQTTEVSFPSFVDPSALPIKGKIRYISANVINMGNSQMPSYRIVVEITEDGERAIEKNNFNIIAGMPSAIFIHTGKKTLASYLLSPIIQMFKGIFHAN